jgi:hypothetical protein
MESASTLEKRWFERSRGALRAGRVGMVTVHVPDSLDASFETIRKRPAALLARAPRAPARIVVQPDA